MGVADRSNRKCSMFGMTQTAMRAPFGHCRGGRSTMGKYGKRPCSLGTSGIQVLQRLRQRDDVRVLGVEVEEALLVRRGRAVAHGLAHHHGPEAVLHRV